MKPPVVVLGATGQVGLFAISRLLELGRQVIAITRSEASHEIPLPDGLRRVSMSGLQQTLARLEDTMGGKPALLSCGPVRLAAEVIQLRQPAIVGHWERVVVVGTTSTITKKVSPDSQERALIAEIDAALEVVCEVCDAGRVPLTVLSPTLIYGCGMDQNLSRVFGWIRRFGFVPIASKAHGLRQPLHVEDLARTLVNALEADAPDSLDSPVCGGETLPYEQMTGRLFDAADKRRRLFRLHGILVPPVIALARILPGMSGLNSQMFRRQSTDMVFDDGPARKQLGHEPRAFQPGHADFQLPAHCLRIQEALAP